MRTKQKCYRRVPQAKLTGFAPAGSHPLSLNVAACFSLSGASGSGPIKSVVRQQSTTYLRSSEVHLVRIDPRVERIARRPDRTRGVGEYERHHALFWTAPLPH